MAGPAECPFACCCCMPVHLLCVLLCRCCWGCQNCCHSYCTSCCSCCHSCQCSPLNCCCCSCHLNSSTSSAPSFCEQIGDLGTGTASNKYSQQQRRV
jgi:hypothetical protein